MRHARNILVAVVLVGTLTGLAAADFIEWPVKWSQTPWDPAGGDYLSDHTVGAVVADDFICDRPEPIEAVRWWGSYIGETDPRTDGFTGPFDISFHYSVGPHPVSMPGALVAMYTVNAQEVFVGFDTSGEPVYRYDAYLPVPFDQWLYSQDSQNGNKDELFLDICKPTGEQWGWHEVVPPHPIMDFAAVGAGGANPHEPTTWVSTDTDMAFELMIPEPATMSVLALGGVGVLIRRRRRHA